MVSVTAAASLCLLMSSAISCEQNTAVTSLTRLTCFYVAQVSFVLASQFLLKSLSLTAARWLHNSMLKQLLRWVQAILLQTR